MSSGGFDSNKTPAQPDFDDEPGIEKVQPLVPELLEKVLDETLSAATAGDALDPGELESLLEVARQYKDEPFSLEPAAFNLVQAILKFRFEKLANKGDAWPAMTREIAASLLEDPASHDRLKAFWARLVQAVS